MGRTGDTNQAAPLLVLSVVSPDPLPRYSVVDLTSSVSWKYDDEEMKGRTHRTPSDAVPRVFLNKSPCDVVLKLRRSLCWLVPWRV